MRRHRIIAGVLVTVACALVGGTLLLTNNALAQKAKKKAKKAPTGPASTAPVSAPGQGEAVHPLGAVAGPLPPPTRPPDIVNLSTVEKVGKFMLYDTTLSDPQGYACATCHVPEAGFTGPSSIVNEISGTMPGVVPGRFSNRKPQSYVYAAFAPVGPSFNANLRVWVGGTFWDGRTADLAGQAHQPPINPNEMANTPTNGIFPPVFGGFSALLAQKLQTRPYTPLFLEVYGQDAFTKYTPQQIYELFCLGTAAYQSTGEVCGFSSKYDASIYGVPPQNLYTLSASEERGRVLYFGAAQCSACHSSAGLPNVTQAVGGKETFTMYCYANIGVPRNVGNPFYQMIGNLPGGCTTNPHGCNPLGTDYIDFGLGSNPNPAPNAAGTRFFNTTPGDIPEFRGLFKAPSNRDVDLRPSPAFVKAYMHNGVFKSLQTVVHFYNKRNIATDANGNEVAFDLSVGPPPGTTRLFPPPEVIDNVQNVVGFTPAQALANGTTGVTASNGQVGNLQLSAQDEIDLVNFLKILSDFFTAPNPVANPL